MNVEMQPTIGLEADLAKLIFLLLIVGMIFILAKPAIRLWLKEHGWKVAVGALAVFGILSLFMVSKDTRTQVQRSESGEKFDEDAYTSSPQRYVPDVLAPRIDLEEEPVPPSDSPESPASPKAASAPKKPEKKTKSGTDQVKNEPPAFAKLPQGMLSDGTYRLILVTDPKASYLECERQLDESINEEIYKYYESKILGRVTKRFIVSDGYYRNMLNNAGITQNYIRQYIVKETQQVEYNSENISSPEPLIRIFARIEIDPEVQNDFQRFMAKAEYRDIKRQAERRSIELILIGCLILAGLSAIYGLIWLDNFTKGYYTKRLIAGGILVTIVVVVIAANS